MSKRASTIEIYFDGLCEPNPGGFTTYGFVITGGGRTIFEGGGEAARPGTPEATNNVAEYTGLVRALEKARELKLTGEHLQVFGDSKLVVCQVGGQWKVRDKKLAPLYLRAKELAAEFARVDLVWVPREHNKVADRLSYEAYIRLRR